MKTCTKCCKNKTLEEFYYKKTEERYTSWCRKCYEVYRQRRWIERKRKLVQIMGEKCQKCGYNQCLAALHFHHKDPSEKDGDWRKISRWPWNRIIKEIKKCILLCANCHAEHHATSDLWLIMPTNKGNLFLDSVKPNGQCPICKTDTYGTKHCSTKCRAFARRKTVRPSKTKLSKLISEHSWTSIGRKYGVSDNAVRKWAKHHRII